MVTNRRTLGRKAPSQPGLITGMLLLGAVALCASGPSAAELGAAPPVQLAQSPPTPAPPDGTDQPERSPEQREAERRLEREAEQTEGEIDQQRDEFEESEAGEDAREEIDEAREEMERQREELERERDEFENDPEETSCCNPGYKEGVLRAFDRRIEQLEEEFERERRRILDEEMKKKDEERAAVLEGLQERLQRILDQLKRLRDMPPLPPPGLTGYPDDGGLVLAMLPGVSFAGAGDPFSDPRVRRALMDQSGVGRAPAVSIPRMPTMQPHMLAPSVEIRPTPRPPMEVIPR
jgi:hypothetical protein